MLSGGSDVPPPKLVREMTVVNIVPPPPPPPPPPEKMIEKPKEIEEPKMVDKPIEETPVEKPVDDPVKDAKNEEPPGPLALDAKATAPSDLFNLGSKVGGSPYGGRGGGGSRWGWYDAMVTRQVKDALEANPTVKKISMKSVIRIWINKQTGRIERVELEKSTGNAEVDAAIKSEVLGKMTLREPPPNDMPMPMVTRVTIAEKSS
ncbi:TonB C-terminal domain-containing protein [Tardiphaga sp.]|uniref:TonB C-terminal domain-containing protein n=1 Tax=Tardiphaga sp. TaxID=1926292 RepID=UPI00352B1788